MYHERYIPASEIKRHYQVSNSTLRRWANEGTIPVVRFGAAGKRLYARDALEKMLTGNTAQQTKEKVAYARVSSAHQKEDLDRQIEDLRTHFPTHRIISDIASGINFKRRGMQTILELAFSGSLQEVVVMHRDRLARFGVELFETIFEKTGGKLVVFGGDQKDTSSELAEDLLAITTVFVARHNGTRSAINRKRRKTEHEASTRQSIQNPPLPQSTTNKDFEALGGDCQVDVQPVCTIHKDKAKSRCEKGLEGLTPQQRGGAGIAPMGIGDPIRCARRGNERRVKGDKNKFCCKEDALRIEIPEQERRIPGHRGVVEALGAKEGRVRRRV